MSGVTWPRSQEHYAQLAAALADLVGGRQDVAARYHDFEADGRRIKGWGPWKGRAVAKDYKALPGEIIVAQINRKTAQQELRILNPLSPANLIEHLRGRERLGVYVLDAHGQCKFLAADFDDHKGTLDPAGVWAQVRRFVDTCEAHEWIAHVERSKSGKGYHVWLFFDAPVSAADVRAIGRWLFEEAQALREGEEFDTFDRFFPAQSRLPPAGKGYGNLIGLPLCGEQEYAAGRTAWVDAAGEVVADALEHTLGIVKRGRNPAARISAFMAEWGLTAEVAEVYEGKARTEQALGTAEQYTACTERCAFLRWATTPANQEHVHEPLWYSMVSNAARFDVDEAIHEGSRHHPGYSAIETDIKIEHARASSGPHKCKTIQASGYKFCPPGGCKLPSGEATAAPAGLAAWTREDKPKQRGRGVRVQADKPSPAGRPSEAPAPAPVPGGESASPLGVEEELPQPWDTPGGRFIRHDATKLPWPELYGGWMIDGGGVHDHQNQHIVLRPLWVHACTRTNTDLWGVSIRFYDLDWKEKTHAFPRDRLHEQGGVLGRELASLGLPIVPGKEKWVSRFLVLQEQYIKQRIRAATRLGWFDSAESPAVFVLPSQVLGQVKEEIVYQPDQAMHMTDTLHAQGGLADWRKGVADQCTGNPILMFALMTGLAGPLLKPCQEQSGGFHLYGVTTGGKTTAAQVAASCWGCGADPQEGPDITSIRKWYATGNALEGIAEVHNDSCLVLDEISEVDPQELGRIIYQLAGGLSKGRANAGGGLRAMRTWRLLFFSTGEKSVRQMLAIAGQDAKGGQRVRMPDIPADNSDDGGRAIVIDAHGRDAKDFVQDLKAACARHYGLAGPTFVAYLVAEAHSMGGMLRLADALRAELRQVEAALSVDDNGRPLDLPPEARRVLRRFALVALAGLRAAQAGVLAWSIVEIIQAVRLVRDRWLSEQGEERSEMDRGLAHLRDQLLAHADRFRPIDQTKGAPIRDALGFRTEDFFLIHERGMRELCGEFDQRTILRSLASGGYLWNDKGRLTRKSPKIAGLGPSRPNLYWVSLKFLGEQILTDTEEDRRTAVSPETETAGGDDVPL